MTDFNSRVSAYFKREEEVPRFQFTSKPPQEILPVTTISQAPEKEGWDAFKSWAWDKLEPVVEAVTGLKARERQVPELTKKVRLPFALETSLIRPAGEPGLLTLPTSIAFRLIEIIPKVAIQTVQNYKEIAAQGEAEPLKMTIDARRLGFDTSEVESTGRRLVDTFDRIQEANPPKSELDLWQNAAYASLQVAVPDALDAFIAGNIAELTTKFTLKSMGYDPVYEKSVTNLGLQPNKVYSKKEFLERFNASLKAASPVEKITVWQDGYYVFQKTKGLTEFNTLNTFFYKSQTSLNKLVTPMGQTGYQVSPIAPRMALPGYEKVAPGGLSLQMRIGSEVTKKATTSFSLKEFTKSLTKTELKKIAVENLTVKLVYEGIDKLEGMKKVNPDLFRKAEKATNLDEFISSVYKGKKVPENQPLVDFFNKIKGYDVKPTIPEELEPLAEEARKYDTFKEFDYETSMQIGPAETTKIGVSQKMREPSKPLLAFYKKYSGSGKLYGGDYPYGTDALEDFYNQAKAITPKVKPVILPKVKPEKIIREARVPGIPTKTVVRGVTGQVKPELTEFTRRIRDLTRGIREGRIFTKKEILETQTTLLDKIDSLNLEATDKTKFMRTIKNIQTDEQLKVALPDIERRVAVYIEAEEKRTIISSISKELKYTKPVKSGQRKVGKYDYESNKFFDETRKNNKLNQDDAQAKLGPIPGKGLDEILSEVEKIKTRFLSLKANGTKASLELHKQVLADIKRMKAAGMKAKDDMDFEKIMNRQEKVDNLYNAISVRKGDAKSIITKAEGLYRQGFANIESMIRSVAGKDIATEYGPELLENKRDTAIYFQSKKIADSAAKILEVKNKRVVAKELHDMAKKEFTLTDIEGLEIKISKMDLIDIYNSVKNDLIKERYYNTFGKDQVKSLLTNLSPKEMELADSMQELVQGYREVLNQRTIEITGRDMGTVENYWPSSSEHQPSFYDDIRIQGETPSATKARVTSSKVFPVPQNAWIKMLKHMGEAEHVKHLSRPYENLKRTFSDRKIKNQITNKFGEKVYQSLLDHIENISLHKVVERSNLIANLYGKALNNWVKAKIASPTVFARQLVSVINYMEDMPVGQWTKYYLKGLMTPKKTFNFMWKNAPFLEARFHRGYSEAMKDAIKGANDLSVNMNSLSKGITAMVRSGDITAIVYGGYPKVMAELAKGKTMEEAIEVFEKATLKSQQSGVTSSLSHWQNSSSPFAKTFFRFKNTVSQYTRKQADAIIAYRNKEIPKSKLAKITIIYSIINPILYALMGWGVTRGFKATGQAIRGKRVDLGLDDLGSDVIEQLVINPFLSIPIIDSIAKYTYRSLADKNTYEVIQLPLLDEISTSVRKLGKDEMSLDDWLDGISGLQEIAIPIPTQTFLRYYKYLTGDEKEKKIELPKWPGLPKTKDGTKWPSLPSSMIKEEKVDQVADIINKIKSQV